MAGSEKFCLKWNDFEANISGAFRELRGDEDFFDVTLACEDDQVQAHKLILSACSPFFRTILRRNRHEHPLLYLKGVKYGDLVAILNFMYNGEVNVAQEELNTFLSVAEDLKVKGLTQNDSDNQKNNKNVDIDPPKPRPRERPIDPPDKNNIQPKRQRPQPSQPRSDPPTPGYKQQQEEEIQIQEVLTVKSEPPPVPQESHFSTMAVDQSYSDNNPQNQIGILADPNMEYVDEYPEYGEYESGFHTGQGIQDGNSKDLEYLVLGSLKSVTGAGRGTLWQCTHCGKEDKDKSMLKRHIESHFHFKHSCPYCGKEYKSRPSLQCHISTKHKAV